MERTYITIFGHPTIVEGTSEAAMRRWEQAKRTGTFLAFTLPGSDRPRYVNPDAVQGIGDPIGAGVTLSWLN